MPIRKIALILVYCAATLTLAACGSGDNSENTPLPAPLAVSTTTLPGGIVSSAFSQSLAATGGTTPYTWAVASGTLPAGLTLSAAGVISGTPTAAGTSSFTVRVTDSAAATATRALSIDITAATLPAPLAVSTATLPGGIVSSAYSQSLAATGGTTPYTWAVAIGTLPAGLTLSAAGVISGTPTAAGTSNFTVRVTDASAPAATTTRALSLTITAVAPVTVSFSTQIQPIFTANCVNCHNGSVPSIPNLTAGNSFASLVQSASPVVIAGSSATSRLFVRISTSTPLQQMPLGLPPLSDADQTLIQTWIDEGAQNN